MSEVPSTAIVGLGLLGGSLARALHDSRGGLRLVGVDSAEAARTAAARSGLFDEVRTEAETALGRVDLVILATPLGAMPDVLGRLATSLPSSATVTDTCGVKVVVEGWAKDAGLGAQFVGSHPMAGGMQGGFPASRRDLFLHAPVAVCAPTTLVPIHRRRVIELWERVGAVVHELSATAHDLAVAHTSHAPYVAALAHLAALADPHTAALHGRGFADATRHAAFAPEIMAETCLRNAALPAALRGLGRELAHAADLLEKDASAFRLWVEAARARRASLSTPG